MIPVFLTRIKTKDGILLDGIIIKPRRKSKTALLWLHGLSSRFSSGQTLIRELSAACHSAGIAYFKFNTRGHDIANRDAPKKIGFQGTGFEKFEDCILDIRAMIAHAKKLGYRRVVLAGHSTGANKAIHYTSHARDHALRGAILIAPISDIAGIKTKKGARWIADGLAIASRLRKKKTALMPPRFGMITARRFWSLYHPGESEDTFPYHNPRARWTTLQKCRVPLAVIFGARDEYLDRPASALVKIFQTHAPSTKSFTGVIIQGANHGFRRKETHLAHIITDWIKHAVSAR